MVILNFVVVADLAMYSLVLEEFRFVGISKLSIIECKKNLCTTAV
jgi:hypothetical protein